MHLIIADASDEPWTMGVNGFEGDMTWEYFHVPGYDTIVERLRIALERVDTEFMCFLDDEECLLWTGIEIAVKHLETHSDQSCAGGMVAHSVNTPVGLSLEPWGRWAEPWSLMSDSPLERFREMVQMERTANLYYQILRTSSIRRFVASLDGFSFSYRGALEISMAGFLALSGKWEMGSYPFWIRHGSSVISPVSETNYMTRRDIVEVVRILMTSAPDGDHEAADLDELISMLWGIHGHSGNRNDKRPLFSRGSSFVRARTARILKSRSPAVYSWIRNRIPSAKSKKVTIEGDSIMSFNEYANAYGENLRDTRADLESIEAIWRTYPDGVGA